MSKISVSISAMALVLNAARLEIIPRRSGVIDAMLHSTRATRRYAWYNQFAIIRGSGTCQVTASATAPLHVLFNDATTAHLAVTTISYPDDNYLETVTFEWSFAHDRHL